MTRTLEATWSLIFPRFTAIVVELGGELSHASILIRETGYTAVINARVLLKRSATGRCSRSIRILAKFVASRLVEVLYHLPQPARWVEIDNIKPRSRLLKAECLDDRRAIARSTRSDPI